MNSAAQKYADLQVTPLRADEEVAVRAREHDRFVRRIDALVAKRGGGVAQSLPGVLQVLGKMPRECGFCGGPAIVLLAGLENLLAVVTDARRHVPIISDAVAATLPTRVCNRLP